MEAKKILILSTSIAAGLTLAGSVFATQLSISPLTFELTANPGDVLTNKIRIYNPSESAIVIKMKKEDFGAVGEAGEVRVRPAEAETYSLSGWISIIPEEFTLGPNEQKFVDFTISIPANAEPGGKYGSVLASTAGLISPGTEVSGAAIMQELGALVLLTVSGEVVEDLQIKDFSVPSFVEYGPVPFEIRFENNGTVHVKPRGFVTITDWRGKKAADVEFPQQNVLPGAIRKVEVNWDKKWLFGRYTATLVGMYGTVNTPINPPVITFWAFPWRIVLGITLLVGLILAYFIKTRKRWKMALRILIKGEKH